jgi:hypothetical protein
LADSAAPVIALIAVQSIRDYNPEMPRDNRWPA